MKFPKIVSQQRGFTLVELMMTVLISAVVMGVIYYAYANQRKVHKRQEAVVDMQQNARAGLYLITQELRMAGYDPLDIAGAQIQPVISDASNIQYTQDLNEDGDTADLNEDITLNFVAPVLPATGSITRNTGGGAQPFLNNVDFFQLLYLDEDNIPIATPISAADAGDIRAIQISMLIRSSVQEPELLNTLTYDIPPPAPGVAPLPPIAAYNDSFRRRLVATTVQCRNAGL